MNARKALISVFALVVLTFASCGTMNRLGKDLMLGLGTPVLMAYGGATDGVTSAQAIREGMGGAPLVEVLALPFTVWYHSMEHGIYGLAHLVDAVRWPEYGLAELHPAGPEVMPLDIYQGTWFDTWAAKHKQGTDPESGEMIPSGN